MLTLRQIEVVRAVMIAGTIAGAARLLGVSAPGVSRLIKYTERSIRVKLFERSKNRYVPTKAAEDIFEQINAVYARVDDLQFILRRIDRGGGSDLRLATVPSMGNVWCRARWADCASGCQRSRWTSTSSRCRRLRTTCCSASARSPCCSYGFTHPGITVAPLPRGELRCIVPVGHPLAEHDVVAAEQIARFPIVGVHPDDPYGRLTSDVFRRLGLPFNLTMTVRFGTTTIGLVRAGLGVAVVDPFVVAGTVLPDLKVLRIREHTEFEPQVAYRGGPALEPPGGDVHPPAQGGNGGRGPG